jgi:Uma2 family endonuclease
MAEPARPLNTVAPEVWAAYAAAPEHLVAEILDGELTLMPRPGRRHTRGASRLGRYLGPFDDDSGPPGGWVILDEPELRLGRKPDVLVPDLAGWRRERMPDAIGPDDAPPYYDLAPDWVCEVISASTEAHDRGKKRRVYRREGVGWLWFLVPGEQILEVYRLDNKRWREVDEFEGNIKVRAEPFELIELDLGALWAR